MTPFHRHFTNSFPEPNLEGEFDNYTVKGGETLVSIASLFNISEDEIKKTNSLSSDTLEIGQVLLIPPANGDIT